MVVFVHSPRLKLIGVFVRKYLQYVADDIADWLREEELKNELEGLESAQGTKGPEIQCSTC